MATIHDVARLAGVSTTTAKRAIRDPDKLADATLVRVRTAIDTLQYEPDQLASALRSGHTTTIGLIIGSIVEPFFAHLTRTIVHAARQQDYSVVIADNEYRSDLEIAHLRTFSGQRVAGLILRSAFGEGNLDYVLRMRDRGTAIVEVDYFSPGSPLSRVMLDNRGAVEVGVAHLVAHGHRRIASLSDFDTERNLDERVQCFPEVLRSCGLHLPDEYRSRVSPTEWDAYAVTRALMRLDSPPTALLAVNGSMAAGAYGALRELGLRVPDDVSLLAFDDYPWMALVTPGIDTLAQPVDDMAHAAVRLLFEQIRRGVGTPIERVRLPARLIVRGSVRSPQD